MAPVLPPDPYKALGVTKDAQLPEIRSAHRKLVLKCHPDKIHDPQLRSEKADEFQKVQQAYEILSNEHERQKYDVLKELADLKEQRNAGKMPSSSRPTRTYYDAPEPRRGSYSSSPTSEKVYSRTPPRSHEDMPRRTEEARSARKAERERAEKEELKAKAARQQEREWEKATERANAKAEAEQSRKKEKEREKDKQRRREEREKEKKKADKQRKRDADDKPRHKVPIPETYETPYEAYDEPVVEEPEEVDLNPPSKSDKKKSSSRKHEEPAHEDVPPSSERERKQSFNMDFATQYLSRSGATVPPGMKRSSTDENPAPNYYAPTPPPAHGHYSPFPPPRAEDIINEEATPRRSSKSSRHPPSSREKSSHKKSSGRDRSRDPMGNPIIVDAVPPAFTKSRTMPTGGEYVRSGLHRSNTDQYTRTPPTPSFNRSETYHGHDPDRARSRSRNERTAAVSSSEEDSDDERERRHRRKGRGHTPEESTQHTYRVAGSKAIPINIREAVHPSDASPRSHKSKTNYANTGARMDPRHGYEGYGEAQYYNAKYNPTKVAYANIIDSENIAFSQVPHSTSYPREQPTY